MKFPDKVSIDFILLFFTEFLIGNENNVLSQEIYRQICRKIRTNVKTSIFEIKYVRQYCNYIHQTNKTVYSSYNKKSQQILAKIDPPMCHFDNEFNRLLNLFIQRIEFCVWNLISSEVDHKNSEKNKMIKYKIGK